MIEFEHIRAAFPALDLGHVIKESGQRVVIKAEHDATPVVLKILHPDPQGAERLAREISAVATLASDRVPKIEDYGNRLVGSTPVFFIVEQFLEGESLRNRLDRQGPLDLAGTLAVGEALLSTVVELAAIGVVHRDIKPDNIMIGTDGKVWLIDFGIVRTLGLESLTPSDAQFGSFTLGYGAPEQMRNDKRSIDQRADLFSVGITPYECISGINPHVEGKDNVLEILNHVQSQQLPELIIPGDTESNLSRVVASMCSRFPSRRPQTAVDALSWFREAGGVISEGEDAQE